MFDTLSDRLQDTFARLRGHGRLSEAQVDAALREVRLALLEADVNFKVVKDFIARVRERSVGEEVTRSLTPAQQVVKIVHEELVVTLGERNVPLQWSPRPPTVLLMAGLQGSGKTTTAAKLARWLNGKGRKPLDRKSTRLNSSHANISYAVFCLIKHLPLLHSHLTPL